MRRSIELGVKSIEHGQFLSEETARLGKEKGVFFQGNLAGRSEALLNHPFYGGNAIVRAKSMSVMCQKQTWAQAC